MLKRYSSFSPTSFPPFFVQHHSHRSNPFKSFGIWRVQKVRFFSWVLYVSSPPFFWVFFFNNLFNFFSFWDFLLCMWSRANVLFKVWVLSVKVYVVWCIMYQLGEFKLHFYLCILTLTFILLCFLFLCSTCCFCVLQFWLGWGLLTGFHITIDCFCNNLLHWKNFSCAWVCGGWFA